MKRNQKLGKKAARAMRAQLKAFRKKFGRDPGPDDPVFFDPDSDTPKPLDTGGFDALILDALEASGAPPEVIYAHKKTGRLGVRGMMDNWPADAVQEWEEPIAEYFRLRDEARKGSKN